MTAVTLICDEHGEPTEIQVFTGPDTDVADIRRRVRHLLADDDAAAGSDVAVAVVGMSPSAPSRPGPVSAGDATGGTQDRRTAELGGRVEIRRVVTASVERQSAMQVILGYGDRKAAGFARDGMGPHGVTLAASATLDAVETLLERPGWLRLSGVEVNQQFGRSTVSVLVANQGTGTALLGATPASDVPFHEAAVRATLDAVNRQIELHLPGGSSTAAE